MTDLESTWLVVNMISDYFEARGYIVAHNEIPTVEEYDAHPEYYADPVHLRVEICISRPARDAYGDVAGASMGIYDTVICFNLKVSTEITIAYGRWRDQKGPLLIEDPNFLIELEELVARPWLIGTK